MLFKLLLVDSVNVVLLVHFWISFILSKNRLYPHSRQTHVRNHCQINDDFKHICQQSSWTVWEIIIIFLWEQKLGRRRKRLHGDAVRRADGDLTSLMFQLLIHLLGYISPITYVKQLRFIVFRWPKIRHKIRHKVSDYVISFYRALAYWRAILI